MCTHCKVEYARIGAQCNAGNEREWVKWCHASWCVPRGGRFSVRVVQHHVSIITRGYPRPLFTWCNLETHPLVHLNTFCGPGMSYHGHQGQELNQLDIVGWEPEGPYPYSIMFCWESEGHYQHSIMFCWEPEGHYQHSIMFWKESEGL